MKEGESFISKLTRETLEFETEKSGSSYLVEELDAAQIPCFQTSFIEEFQVLRVFVLGNIIDIPKGFSFLNDKFLSKQQTSVHYHEDHDPDQLFKAFKSLKGDLSGLRIFIENNQIYFVLSGHLEKEVTNKIFSSNQELDMAA